MYRWVVSFTHSSHFTPRERAPGTHWIVVSVGPRASLDAVEKRRISLPCYKSKPGNPALSPLPYWMNSPSFQSFYGIQEELWPFSTIPIHKFNICSHSWKVMHLQADFCSCLQRSPFCLLDVLSLLKLLLLEGFVHVSEKIKVWGTHTMEYGGCSKVYHWHLVRRLWY
jgi:hypothetical protein